MGLISKFFKNTDNEDIQVFQSSLTAQQREDAIYKAYGSLVPKKTYYISNNGLDTNNGLTELTPFKTIAKALTLISDYTTLKFECGSIFYEPLVYQHSNLTFESYGIGNNPIIDGSSIINTPTLVSGNVWQTTNTYVSTDTGRHMLMEDGVPMQPVASQAECEALPNSYVVTSGDSFAAGVKTIMFHTSDNASPLSNGKAYSTNLRDCIKPLNDVIRQSIKIKNIDVQYSFYQTPLAIFGSINGVLDNCRAKYGNKHNVFIADYGIGKNIIAYDAELQGEYGRTATMYVAYSATADVNKTFKWENCVAIQDIRKTGIRRGLTGFLDHAPVANFKKGYILNCYGKGLDVPFSTDSVMLEVNNCYFEKVKSKVISANANNNNIVKNSFFSRNFIGDTTDEKGSPIYKNNTYINHAYNNCSTANMTIDNCLFYGGNKIKSQTSLMGDSPTKGALSLKMNNTIIFGYGYFLMGTIGTNYVANYNVFYNTKGISFRATYNGIVFYDDFTGWQTATGQDSQSVYLTDTQAKTFFLTDPTTGVVTINPFAEVTSSNGTVYTGTFPDGTLLTDKFTNKNYSHLKSKYVDELDLLQYQN